MTAPTPPDPQEAADVLADRLLAVTVAAMGPISTAIQDALQVVVAALVADWVLSFGSTDGMPADTAEAAPFIERAHALIGEIALPPSAQEALEDAVADAYQEGLGHAALFAPSDPLSARLPAERELPDLSRVLDEQRVQALRALDERAVVDSGFPAVVQGVAKLRRAVPRIDSNVSYETTKAANNGVINSTPPGWVVMWVAERDACLVCLAYAGETTTPGASFAETLTFGDRPMRNHEPLTSPPKHPNCRCTLQPLHPGDTDVPANLKREARRSVLRGWADDESVPAKLRAADRLLAVGANLPKSVEARARNAVREGRFN